MGVFAQLLHTMYLPGINIPGSIPILFLRTVVQVPISTFVSFFLVLLAFNPQLYIKQAKYTPVPKTLYFLNFSCNINYLYFFLINTILKACFQPF